MEKKEFARDFSEFFAEVKKEGIEASVENVATLYAIYRKDLRADRMNNKAKNNCNGINGNSNKSNEDPGKEPASERQKCYLMDLAYKKWLCIAQRELDRMTREEASKTIDTLLGGTKSPSLNS